MSEDKLNNSDKLLENLFKKWELYWNHYKLQHEAYERRRYVIWLIQSALAVAWYKTFYGHTLISLGISFFATIFSLLWFFMCRRERESIFLTEEHLRTTEKEIININKGANFNYFISRGKIFGPQEIKNLRLREDFQIKIGTYWDFNNTIINSISKYLDIFYCNREIKSVKFLLDFFIPLSFFIMWEIIFIYTSFNITKVIFITIALGIILPIILLFILFWDKKLFNK